MNEFFKGGQLAEKYIKSASVEALNDLNLGLSFYEAQCEKIAKVDRNFAMINLYMFEAIKTKIPSNKPALTQEKVEKIFKYQLDNFDTTDFSFAQNVSPQ